MAKFYVSRRAEADIVEIVDYIALDNPQASMAFYSRLLEFFETIAENPLSGRERPDLKEGLRYFPTGSYLVFYRVWAGRVEIVRVLHSARELDEIFS